MTRLLLALATGTALATAVPAAAQYGAQSRTYADAGAETAIAQRIEQLEDRLWEGFESGAIDRSEARAMRTQLRQLTRVERQYMGDGTLSQNERRDLLQRLRSVRQQIRTADGGTSRYAEWRDDDVYAGYDPNRSDTTYGGVYGSNSSTGYQQVDRVCRTTNTVGTIFSRIFGSDDCLRVGERVTTTLNAVPTEYRNQFPPRSGYRYGFIDNHVVEIDSRTTVVTRIYALG